MSHGASPDFEPEPQQPKPHELLAKLYEQQGRPYNFLPYAVGSLVLLDIVGERLDDMVIEPDQFVVGELVDNQRGRIHVLSADYRNDLVGFTIGLATRMPWSTPGGTVDATFNGVVAPNRDAAFYLPKDLPAGADNPGQDGYSYFFGTYKCVKVGNHKLFGA